MWTLSKFIFYHIETSSAEKYYFYYNKVHQHCTFGQKKSSSSVSIVTVFQNKDCSMFSLL